MFVTYLWTFKISCNHHNLILLDYTYNFNQLKIILNIIKVIKINITIQIVLVFIKTRGKNNNIWALIILWEIFEEDLLLEVIFID